MSVEKLEAPCVHTEAPS